MIPPGGVGGGGGGGGGSPPFTSNAAKSVSAKYVIQIHLQSSHYRRAVIGVKCASFHF